MGWRYTDPVAICLFGGEEIELIFSGLDEEDKAPEDWYAAAHNFATAPRTVLTAAAADLYRYYEDCVAMSREFGEALPPKIASPDEVWEHVEFHREEILLRRRPRGDRAVYVSASCTCRWKPEHGLQVVFRNGESITKLGPFDDHLTNEDATLKPELAGVVYVGR